VCLETRNKRKDHQTLVSPQAQELIRVLQPKIQYTKGANTILMQTAANQIA